MPSAILAGLGFFLTFPTGVWGLMLVLFPGLALLLLSALTAWLWAWRLPVGAVAWAGLLLMQVIIAKDLFTVSGP